MVEYSNKSTERYEIEEELGSDIALSDDFDIVIGNGFSFDTVSQETCLRQMVLFNLHTRSEKFLAPGMGADLHEARQKKSHQALKIVKDNVKEFLSQFQTVDEESLKVHLVELKDNPLFFIFVKTQDGYDISVTLDNVG